MIQNRLRWFIVSLFVIGACGHPSPPPAPEPPPVRWLHANVSIRNLQGMFVESAQGTLQVDSVEGPGAVVSQTGGRQSFPLLEGPSARPGWGATLTIEAPDYQPFTSRVVVPDGDGELPEVALKPIQVVLPRLVVRGKFFGLDNGERFTVIGATDFNLLARFIQGEDITPVLAQRQAVGFNTVRVFTAFDIFPGVPNGIGRLVPREHPDLYIRIPGFLDELARYGLYAELVGFTGPYRGVLDTDDDKVLHWVNLCNAVALSTNVTLELVNEYDNPPNIGLPLGRLQKCRWAISSHGSATQDVMPLTPFWDYATYHPGGGDPREWPRKTAHNGMDVAEAGGVPTVSNENKRAPDQDNLPLHFREAAAGCALLSAGCTFHSVSGKSSQLWSGAELEAAKAWVEGAKSIPLGCQDGGYIHRTDLEGPGVLRAYQRGTDPKCVVVVHQ